MKIFFIDYEDIEESKLPKLKVEDNDCVYLFYTERNVRIRIPLLKSLGYNYECILLPLDDEQKMCMASYIGQVIAENRESGNYFVLASKDKRLDKLMEFWQSRRRDSNFVRTEIGDEWEKQLRDWDDDNRRTLELTLSDVGVIYDNNPITDPSPEVFNNIDEMLEENKELDEAVNPEREGATEEESKPMRKHERNIMRVVEHGWNKETATKVLNIVNKSSQLHDTYLALVKEFKAEKGLKIYNTIKPMIKKKVK